MNDFEQSVTQSTSGTSHRDQQSEAELVREFGGLRVPFGMKDGRLFAAKDTNRGKACDCVCPGCGSALVSNQGEHKRAYFSHFRGADCVGGYESAIHLMAKQVIQDAGRIVLPEFKKTLERRLPTGDVLTEVIELPEREIEFASVRQEQSAEGLRPDVTGVLQDGTEIFIEVYVTHAVTQDKRLRFANRNMVELDLSFLARDELDDESEFAKKVLSEACREWISCQLYREEIASARRKLRKRVRQFVRERRADIEKKKREIQQQELEEQAERRRKQEILQRREQLRESHSFLLDQLREMVVEGGMVKREQFLEKAFYPEKPALLSQLGLEELPSFLSVPIKGDWMFEVHRSVWQAFIFEAVVLRQQPGYSIGANSIKRDVVNRFGLLGWAMSLNNLKYQYKVQGRARGAWYGSKGVWFFTDRENRQIPSPYMLVLSYLKALVAEGFLVQTDHSKAVFTVRFNSIESLESYRADEAEKERLAILEHERWVEAELKAHRQREEARLAKARADMQQRAQYLIQLVQSFANQGINDLKRCNRCSHFQQENDGSSCAECGDGTLWDVQITRSYLESLPHRLRSLRLLP